MRKEKSCGAVVYKKEHDNLYYLIIKQSKGHVAFPKGHVEDGETVLQASFDVLNTSGKFNEDGVYETDFIEITLWNNIAENTSEYCKKGDLIGVRGRIQVDSYEVDGEKRSSQKIVADRVTFLSSRPKPEPEPAL